MSLIWFRPTSSGGRTVAEYAEHLAPFGVTLKPRGKSGCIVYRTLEEDLLVKEIGELTTGRNGVVILPRRDASESDVMVLLGAAERALRVKPSRASGWEYRRTKRASWWQATIMRAVDELEDEASAFRTAAHPVDDLLAELTAEAVSGG
jgi:hypothetical protein